jgi:hypothetical protein
VSEKRTPPENLGVPDAGSADRDQEVFDLAGSERSDEEALRGLDALIDIAAARDPEIAEARRRQQEKRKQAP